MKRIAQVLFSLLLAFSFIHDRGSAKTKTSIRLLNQFQAHNLKGESLIQVIYSATSSEFMTVASDGKIRLWDEKKILKAEFSLSPPAMVFNGRFIPGDQSLITAAYNGMATRWSTIGLSQKHFGPHLSGVTDVDVLNNNRGFITTSDDGSIRFWTSDGHLVKRIERPGVSRHIALARKHELVAVTQDIGTITILSTSGEILETFKSSQGRLNDIIFSPDETELISAGFDGTIKIWTLNYPRVKPKLKATISGKETGWVNGLAINKAGILASVADDGKVRLWNLKGEHLSTLKLNSKHLLSCAYSPNGEKLLVATQDGTISEIEVKQ